MSGLQQLEASCPYCGEWLDWWYEAIGVPQSYFDDCAVCCQPVRICVDGDDQCSLQRADD